MATTTTATTPKSTTRGYNNSSSSSTDNRGGSPGGGGMGFLLVFFPDDNKAAGKEQTPHPSPSAAYSPGNTTCNYSKQTTPTAIIKRTNSSNPILTKAQSTISICSFLLLFSFLLFALSTFEPPVRPPHPATIRLTSRRFLSDVNPPARTTNSLYYWLTDTAGSIVRRTELEEDDGSAAASFALQGMGRLYRRGTRSMADLLVGHVAEDTNAEEFRLFLRMLHRSGVTSRTDVVFLFPSSSDSRSGFESVILEENDSFSALIQQHFTTVNRSPSALLTENATVAERSSLMRFDATRFVRRRSTNKETQMVEPTLWGKKIRLNTTSTVINATDDGDGGESTRLSYGSVVGFEANELDPENSLHGFFQSPQMGLRRWACYPMLLGRVKRNFKHVMLADVKSTLIVAGDPIGRVKNLAPESVVYFTSAAAKHKKGGRREKSGHRTAAVNPAIVTGGGRGIRRLSAAMLTEIVRAAMQQHKRKGGGVVTESGILTHLLIGSSSEHILKNVKLTASPESIPDWGVVRESDSSKYSIIQRGNDKSSSDDVGSVIMKRICACEDNVDSVYRDCCHGREL